MNLKFKKTSAALLVATMTVAGSSYAWADENLFEPNEESTETAIVENTDDTSNTSEDVTINSDEETTEANEETSTETTEDDQTETTDIEFPEIPEGYPAGNLVALKQAYENAGNATAKAAIVRNAERAIAEFEAKQEALKNEETTTIEINDDVVEQTQPKEETVTEQPTTKAPVVKTPTVKEERKELKVEQKTERKALQEEHKIEKKELVNQQKSEKQANKENK